RRRHTRSKRDWSSDVCSSDLPGLLCLLTKCVLLWMCQLPRAEWPVPSNRWANASVTPSGLPEAQQYFMPCSLTCPAMRQGYQIPLIRNLLGPTLTPSKQLWLCLFSFVCLSSILPIVFTYLDAGFCYD